jgi:lysophospholipid acyltransferase 5
MDGGKLISKKAPEESTQPEKTIPKNQTESTNQPPTTPPPKIPLSFQKNIALPTLPSYISTLAYAHFFTAFLTGPQFSYHLYQSFINMGLYPDPSHIPRGSYKHAIQCVSGGIVYLLVSQVGQMFFPLHVLLSPEYSEWSLLHRAAYFWMVGKFAFSKVRTKIMIMTMITFFYIITNSLNNCIAVSWRMETGRGFLRVVGCIIQWL